MESSRKWKYISIQYIIHNCDFSNIWTTLCLLGRYLKYDLSTATYVCSLGIHSNQGHTGHMLLRCSWVGSGSDLKRYSWCPLRCEDHRRTLTKNKWEKTLRNQSKWLLCQGKMLILMQWFLLVCTFCIWCLYCSSVLYVRVCFSVLERYFDSLQLYLNAKFRIYPVFLEWQSILSL